MAGGGEARIEKTTIKATTWLVGVLFFGAVWGLSEAALGDVLYSAEVPLASVVLTGVAFMILAVARSFLPTFGAATLIAASAMLYKLLNVPFFPCHLVGILMLGVGFDLAFLRVGERLRWARAAAAAWLGYALFAVLLAFVVGVEPWRSGGITEVVSHIALDGSLAAIVSAVVVPIAWRVGERWRGVSPTALSLEWRPAQGLVALTTAGAWAFGLAGFVRGAL